MAQVLGVLGVGFFSPFYTTKVQNEDREEMEKY